LDSDNESSSSLSFAHSKKRRDRAFKKTSKRDKNRRNARASSVSSSSSSYSDEEPIRRKGKKAQEKEAKEILKKEIRKHQESGDRAVHLDHVRTLFNDVFDVEEDADFIHHIPASEADVQAFLNLGKGGPLLTDIHWDVMNPAKNAWNQRIAIHLAGILSARQHRERWCHGKKGCLRLVREASIGYWTDAVLEKFVRIRRVWTKAKSQVVEDPFRKGKFRMETEEETLTRMEEDATLGMEEHRRQVRQGDVRNV
jgi:hypothetical protein